MTQIIYMISLFAGDLGCSVDALSFLDKSCSGKQNCRYFVGGDEDLVTTRPCSSEGSPYLEVDYSCIKGMVHKQWMHTNAAVITIQILEMVLHIVVY